MQTGNFRKALCTALLVAVSITTAAGQKTSRADSATVIPTNTLLRIMRAEDERRWDENLAALIADKDARVRKRAVLAAGRIGDVRAVPALVEALKTGTDQDVRQMAAFAIGEVESPAGAEELIAVLDDTREPAEVRARAVEALGKIGGALLSNAPPAANQAGGPKAEDPRLAKIRVAILDALKFESGRRSMPDRLSILLGLTAALRVRPEAAGPVIIRFLGYTDPRIVADALNTMARLRLKDGSDQVRQLLGNADAIVRANAARVTGAAEDKQAFEALLDRALHDNDLRVRVSAIRALGSLKDARASKPLLRRGTILLSLYPTSNGDRSGRPTSINELLEIATVLGRLAEGKGEKDMIDWFLQLRNAISASSPEVEIALARIAPGIYLLHTSMSFVLATQNPNAFPDEAPAKTWRQQASIAQGLGALASLKNERTMATLFIRPYLQCRFRDVLPDRKNLSPCFRLHTLAISDYLRAYAALKPDDLTEILRQHLTDRDVIIRATAAELLGEQPSNEISANALIEALPLALRDKDLDDAALSILDALAKQKSAAANDAIKTALDSSDHLIRRRAVALLKANGVGDFSDHIGTVKTRDTEADYRRAIARIGKKVSATVVTTKGTFTIEFLSEEAPLTVDNFVQLARKGYFNRQTVPRVVPNFVIQTGDPRGDQNGGPGYQIRCEINEAPYERGAVGMALSGKDTGGSQWFVTHSPQPHLDGGYTVFGRVIRGMDVVDKIARGDTILRVIVNER